MTYFDSFRKRLPELSSQDIDEIVSFLESHFCTIFHEIDFNIIVSEVFNTEFTYSLVYTRDGALVALCPLHSVKEGLLQITHSNLAMHDIRYGGWIYDKGKVSIHELMGRLSLHFNEKLTYWSPPQIKDNDYSEVDGKIEFNTPIIDLSMSVEEILHQSLSRKRRQTINNAIRKGVVIEELQLADLDIFVQQCRNLKQSIGFSPLPGELFVRLYKRFSPEKRISFLISKLENQYLASGVIISNSNIAHLWIAGKPIEMQTNIPRQDLLIWESIKWAKQIGCDYYDLCYINVQKQEDIARHKLGFTRNIVPFYCITEKSLFSRVVSRL